MFVVAFFVVVAFTLMFLTLSFQFPASRVTIGLHALVEFHGAILSCPSQQKISGVDPVGKRLVTMIQGCSVPAFLLSIYDTMTGI